MKKALIAFAAVAASSLAMGDYEAKWESLDKRPVPQWWTDAKFGIFIHWGPYAVPAYAPTPDGRKFNSDLYAEWYHGKLIGKNKKFVEHHEKMYGNAPYGNFAAEFKAENFDAKKWANLFKRAGARYVVITSKHHDGYALWPSPETPYYNSVMLGSGRDIAREFCDAMREAGLKRGFYYSLLEYANPYYPSARHVKDKTALSIEEWNERMNLPQLKELADKYEADIIWPDGEWDFPSSRHCSEKYLAWLFNESKVKDTVVVNDRWGNDSRGRHGGHYTTEYLLEGFNNDGVSDTHPWEECRGIGNSFGYNRFETPDEYMTRERCIETLVSCVSRGGNLLLNIGPTADGRIPAIMQDRLLAMGRWLEVNGEAIYATQGGGVNDPGAKDGKVYYTRKGSSLYAICFKWPKGELKLSGVGAVKGVSLLGSQVAIGFKADGNSVVIDASSVSPADMPCELAWVFKLSR